MRLALLVASAFLGASTAEAQLVDRLSRGAEPNAITRALDADTRPDTRLGAPVQNGAADAARADRLRAEQAARDAAARRAPPPTSTLTDGPSGVQRLGSGATSPNPPPPAPALPQP